MSAKTSYVIRLSEDLYLDSNNNFLPGALPNLPVYALAGGDLPLSDDTRKALLHQMLAALPQDGVKLPPRQIRLDALHRELVRLVRQHRQLHAAFDQFRHIAYQLFDRPAKPVQLPNQQHVNLATAGVCHETV